MSMGAFMTAVQLGLIYGLMTLGLFVSYRILDIPDLTVDGSFTLGAAVSAVLTISGHPVLGIVCGIGAGALAGVVTALLQTKLKVQPILAGILTMTGLYSINLMVMSGKPNVPLLGNDTLFTIVATKLGDRGATFALAGGIVVVVVIGLGVFLHTQLGLAIRATGDNEAMVSASSINVDLMKILGLALANSLVGLSGALLAQHQLFADASMGIGMVVIGLASLIIGEIIFGKLGELLFKRNVIIVHALAVVLGSIIYRWIIAIALDLNISTSSMKLVSAVIVALAISAPTIKENIQFAYKKKRGGKYVTHQ
ncbi:MAG: ABC transporter permease [Cellulosilyticaceae bacterium]